MFAAGRFTLAGGARSRLPPSFPRVTLASGATTGTTARVSEDGGAVALKFGGESSADRYVFPAVFLRDNCSRSVHPTTLQRTVPVWELPHDLAIQSALPDDAAETVTVCWNDAADAGTGAGAGHEGSGGAAAGPAAAGLPSTFSYSWLKAHRLDPGADGAHSKMGNQAEALELQPWRPAELPDGPGILPSFEYAGVMSSDDELLRLLDAIATLGVARITAMEPGDADGGLKLAQRIGHGRATVFGDHFEVKVEAVPNNQAYTSDGAQRNAYLFVVMYRGEFLLFLFVVCLLLVQSGTVFFLPGERVWSCCGEKDGMINADPADDVKRQRWRGVVQGYRCTQTCRSTPNPQGCNCCMQCRQLPPSKAGRPRLPMGWQSRTSSGA